MARVNHKKVRQLIAQKRKTITDRQFFTSRLLAGHFEDMAVAQTRRYGHNRRVKVRIVWQPRNGDTASTDNGTIWINAGNHTITAKRTRVERYDIVCGIFAHELGHVLYSDFLVMQSYALQLQAGRWFPAEPPLRDHNERVNAAEILAYIKSDPKHLEVFLQLSHQLENSIEDGFVESRMLNRYPGVLGYSLDVRRAQKFELQPTLTQAIEAEEENGHIWLSISQLIWSYVLFGELKYGEEPLTDERVQVVFSLLSELDRALTDSSAKDRWDITNTILVRCWSYIKDFLEHCEKLAEDAEVSDDGSGIGGVLGALLATLVGASGEAKGDTTPVEESKRIPSSSASAAAKRAETAAKAASTKESEEKDEENEDKTEEGAAPGDPEEKPDSDESEAKAGNADEEAGEDKSPPPASDDGALANQGEDDNPMTGDGGGETASPRDVSSEDGGRIPRKETTDLSEPTGGETTLDDEYTGSGYSNAAADIDRLLDNMAQKAVTTDLETKRTSELNDLAQAISYGNIHDGVSKVVHRMAEVDESLIEQYHEISAPLIHISKQLQRSVSQQLKDKQRGGKQTGLLMGRRLDAHALPRNDGRVFYKNNLPNEAPELAVGILLDESGSMGWGDRATYARATAIILYDFCRSLGIPVMVYGHSTEGSSCMSLYSYAEFDDIDGNDKYRMMDITARSSNRDGAALRYVAEQISKRPEEIKILITVSDGQPADTGYMGTAAEEDLRGVKSEYSKKHILFVAAAIGDDKEDIERIYGDSFLDITDLSKLPISLTGVIKRHIRV